MLFLIDVARMVFSSLGLKSDCLGWVKSSLHHLCIIGHPLAGCVTSVSRSDLLMFNIWIIIKPTYRGAAKIRRIPMR